MMTSCLFYFSDLAQTIVRTKENVEKKQALTYEEMEAEREEVVLLVLSLCFSSFLFFSCFFFFSGIPLSKSSSCQSVKVLSLQRLNSFFVHL